MKVIPVAALVTVALPVAPAAAQAPGLPRTFNVTRIDSPTPVGGGAFGWGIYSADLTGDRKQDLLVAQAQVGTADDPNKVFIFNGVTGALVDTIVPPEDNPPNVTETNPSGYVSPEMAFVYIETMPDLGSCPGGDGPDAGKICDASVIGPGDGIPEILVGSRALKVNKDNGATPATNSDRPVGRGYVLDGATRAVLKRIDMPVADRRQNAALGGSPAFGRTMASPQGLPPCAGLTSENNDSGVGPCPADPNYSQAVRIGDLDGGGKPDIVITARGFPETGKVVRNDGSTAFEATAPAGSHCASQPTKTQGPATGDPPKDPALPSSRCNAGKAWTYRGEDIAGSSPQTILDTPMYAPSATNPNGGIQNPDAQASPAGGEWGGNMFRVGDLTGGDGIPDFVIPFRSADFPLRGTPDLNTGLNMGSAYLFDGRTGSLARRIVSPEPQIRSQFSGNFNAGRAVGDLGATQTPDILLPAPLQNLAYADQGRLWVFNGDLTAGGGGEQSWNFAMLNDPEPYVGGNFGGGMTGVGDLVGGPGAPANEVLVGGYRFDTFTEASQNVVPDVNFMNATLDKNLMTIPHPEGTSGDGFGVGITPMGDLNGDGFLDFAVSAYLADGVTGGQGRAWIFTSDNSPLPPAPTQPAAVATGPAAPPAAAAVDRTAAALLAGRCANRTIGTAASETLRGTIAGDQIFGFGGNDRIMGFQGEDCIDGGAGNDQIWGGVEADKLVGGSGRDRLKGEDGRDKLYGESGNDVLDGGYDNDMLAGGAGNDRLLGGAGNDKLYGEAGIDRIIGGGGRNQIDGGKGNDSIEARNGERDRIICGPGRDRVRADRYDRLNGCEVVTYGGKITKRKVLPPRVRAGATSK